MNKSLLLMVPLATLALVLTAAVAKAAPGDSWILPIDHLNGGGWTEYPGAGWNGTSAWGANGMDGARRVYWDLANRVGSSPMETGVNLYTIECYVPTAGGTGWQPIESQISGAGGEVWPMDPLIPWAGMYGTDHQYIGSDAFNAGLWNPTGPGPHTPETADFNAGANGIYMWLNVGAPDDSWLYAKWDYGWSIDRAWSALRITQITTTVPEPSVLALGLLGGLALLRGFRRAKP